MDKNVFGQLHLLDPDWQLQNILDWIDKGNASLLTISDYEKLLRLTETCQNEALVSRANEFLEKRKK